MSSEEFKSISELTANCKIEKIPLPVFGILRAPILCSLSISTPSIAE
jgi:hypothetical protein